MDGRGSFISFAKIKVLTSPLKGKESSDFFGGHLTLSLNKTCARCELF